MTRYRSQSCAKTEPSELQYLSGYIGCTDTPKGRQAIVEINQVLRALPREPLDEAYAAWLDPESRSDYLKDTKAFFDNLAQP